MNNFKKLILVRARKSAEKALKRDANRTSCVAFYQPKAPEQLKNFKKL